MIRILWYDFVLSQNDANSTDTGYDTDTQTCKNWKDESIERNHLCQCRKFPSQMKVLQRLGV